MAAHVVREESAIEFFKEQVEYACARQGVLAHPATSYYIVTLLAAFTHLESSRSGEALASNEPLGIRLFRALERGGRDQRIGLKAVGDVALFVSGFFSDSLRRSLVDIDYYMSLGGYAYGSLGRDDSGPMADTFEELSAKFAAFVDVLAEVSERSALTSNTDLLRLYERCARTGSRRDGQLLVERGLLPPTGASKRVQ